MSAQETANQRYRRHHAGWWERAVEKMREQQKLERAQRMSRVKFGVKVKA